MGIVPNMTEKRLKWSQYISQEFSWQDAIILVWKTLSSALNQLNC